MIPVIATGVTSRRPLILLTGNMMLIKKFVLGDAREIIEAEIKKPSYLPGVGGGRMASPLPILAVKFTFGKCCGVNRVIPVPLFMSGHWELTARELRAAGGLSVRVPGVSLFSRVSPVPLRHQLAGVRGNVTRSHR